MAGRLEDVVYPCNRIVDEDCLRRVTCRGIWPDLCPDPVASPASLPVPGNGSAAFVDNAVAIGERLDALGDCNGGIGCALHELAVKAHLRGNEHVSVAFDLSSHRHPRTPDAGNNSSCKSLSPLFLLWPLSEPLNGGRRQRNDADNQ